MKNQIILLFKYLQGCWSSNYCQRWCRFCCLCLPLLLEVFFYFLILFCSCIIILKYSTVVYCEDFFHRQHTNRVEIIENIIVNSDQKDILLSINKCLQAKVSTLNEYNNISIDSSSMEPLIKSPATFGEFFKRFFLWFFLIIISLLFDGCFTFTTYLFNDIFTLQQTNLYLFEKLKNNPQLVDELYKLLINLEIL